MAAQQTYGGYFVHQASLRHSVHGMAARVSMHVGARDMPGRCWATYATMWRV